jgi:hypothetical protein
MTGRTFAPIADPLKLTEEDPAKFVAEARDRGIKILQDCTWFRGDDRCGCAAGTALVLRLGYFPTAVHSGLIIKGLDINEDVLFGLSDGFVGYYFDITLRRITDQAAYERSYRIGQSIALAAGFKVAEVEA